MLSIRTIAVWAVLIVLVGAGVAVWLLLAYTGGNTDANQVQLDAIRTAGTIVVGTGGAAALLLAARRQRTAEIALKQKDRDQADAARAHALQERVAEQTRRHQERVAAATEADAAARRITDLYTKAVEQLGSGKAPVRLGGLYALERLAQDHLEQRQTIVNVLCAYLRMPYTLPGDPPADNADDKLITAYRERIQEREVRLAAQRLLTAHLNPEDPHTHFPVPTDMFWADIDLDLSGATLINLDFRIRRARTATFARAHFTGYTWFNAAQFSGHVSFQAARFDGDVSFQEVRFSTSHSSPYGASFNEVQFDSDALFDAAQFNGITSFREAKFNGRTSFVEAQFPTGASFDDAEFTSETYFDQAHFYRETPPQVAPFRSPGADARQQEGDETPTKQ